MGRECCEERQFVNEGRDFGRADYYRPEVSMCDGQTAAGFAVGATIEFGGYYRSRATQDVE